MKCIHLELKVAVKVQDAGVACLGKPFQVFPKHQNESTCHIKSTLVFKLVILYDGTSLVQTISGNKKNISIVKTAPFLTDNFRKFFVSILNFLM